MKKNRITVFTKPWKDISLEELADLVKDMGADGVELPIREGYQVEPDNVSEMLPKAMDVFKSRNLVISSVAGSLEKETIQAMGAAGIPILRICVPIDMEIGYMSSVKNIQNEIKGLQSVLESSKVKVGIQNHHSVMVGSALGIYHLLEGVPSSIACGVLDFAHCALDGEPIEMALDIVKGNLGLINFKNAYRIRTNSVDEAEAEWQILWTTARHGGYSWTKAIKALKEMNYEGDICLPAEYGRMNMSGQLMGDEATLRVRTDIQYLRQLLG